MSFLLLQLVKSKYHRLCGTSLDSFIHEVTFFVYEGGPLLDRDLGFLLDAHRLVVIELIAGCLPAEANAPSANSVA